MPPKLPFLPVNVENIMNQATHWIENEITVNDERQVYMQIKCLTVLQYTTLLWMCACVCA